MLTGYDLQRSVEAYRRGKELADRLNREAAIQLVQAIFALTEKQIEIVIGSDKMFRLNIDGICVIRTRMLPGCEVIILDHVTPPKE